MIHNAAIRLLKGKLIERIKRTYSIESFRVELEDKVDFLPGQFLQVIFDKDNLNNRDLNKYLSLSCSPTKNYIEFTKRLSDSLFSQKLNSLKPGDFLDVKAPLGQCIFSNEKDIVFLIGGIGITPVISIVDYLVEKNLSTKVTVFYSNRTEDDIAFKKELDVWQSTGKISLFYTVTDCQPKDKNCLLGTINQELIARHITCLTERTFFIYGPPKMVEAMTSLCLAMGCVKDKIKKEVFIGY